MLVDKDKIKQKIVEYISNQFWVHDRNPTFTEIYDQYKQYASKGSISNYIEELVAEGKLVKINEGNHVYYSRPKMHVATKFLIASLVLTSISSLFAFMMFNIYEPLVFGLGCIFTTLFWRIFG